MSTKELRKIAWVRGLTESGAARSIRKGARISLPEMARTVGCAVSTLWRWEAGERTPQGKLALKYARVLESLLEGR